MGTGNNDDDDVDKDNSNSDSEDDNEDNSEDHAGAAPAYLYVPNFESCYGEKNLGGVFVHCLPQAKLEDCPSSSWKQLTETLPESERPPLCARTVPNTVSSSDDAKNLDVDEDNSDSDDEEAKEEREDHTGATVSASDEAPNLVDRQDYRESDWDTLPETIQQDALFLGFDHDFFFHDDS